MSREKIGKINVNKLDADIRASRFNRSGLSRELHLSESYISKCISSGLMSRSAEAFTCNLLGRPAGYYFENEEEEKKPETASNEELIELIKGIGCDVIDILELMKTLKTIAGDLHWLVAQEQQKPWTKKV